MKRRKLLATVLATSIAVSCMAGCSKKEEKKEKKDRKSKETVEETEPEETVVETEPPVETEPVVTDTPTVEVPLYVEENQFPEYVTDDYMSDVLQLRALNYFYHGGKGGYTCYALELMPQYKKEYPELDKALTQFDLDMRNDMLEIAIERDSDATYPWAKSDISVRRAQSGVLSFIVTYTDDDGSESFTGYNYLIETGELITLDDVLKLDGFEDELANDDIEFVIDPEGIFYWTKSSTKDNAIVDFYPFGDKTLNNGVGAVSEDSNYVIDFGGLGAFVDYDKDGKYDFIQVDPIEADYSYNGVSISCGDKTFEFEDIFSYSVFPYIVRCNGTNALYVTYSSDNDWRFTGVYEMDPVALINVGTFDGSVGTIYLKGDMVSNYLEDYSEFDGWSIYPNGVFTDPMHFYLETRSQLVGTHQISTLCEATGEGNFPNQINNIYSVNLPSLLEAKIDVVGANVDDDSEYVITAGTKVGLVAIVDNNIAIFATDDGTFVKVVLEEKDGNWEAYIGDVTVSEAFNGVMYAG